MREDQEEPTGRPWEAGMRGWSRGQGRMRLSKVPRASRGGAARQFIANFQGLVVFFLVFLVSS